MSITVLARVFWTKIPTIKYKNEVGKVLSVSPRTAKIMLLAIADSADDFGENSFNSYETLTTKTSLKQRRSAIRVCNALQENGYIKNKGLSQYGTNNFSVVLDKLGNIPTKRAKVGRPAETGDSSAETGDSSAKTGDSSAKTGDSESPDSSLTILNPPSSNDGSVNFGDVTTFYENNLAPLTQFDGQLIGDYCDEHTPHWVLEAMKISVKNNKRNLAYVGGILKRWNENNCYGDTKKEEVKNSKPEIIRAPEKQLPPVSVETMRKIRAQVEG